MLCVRKSSWIIRVALFQQRDFNLSNLENDRTSFIMTFNFVERISQKTFHFKPDFQVRFLSVMRWYQHSKNQDDWESESNAWCFKLFDLQRFQAKWLLKSFYSDLNMKRESHTKEMKMPRWKKEAKDTKVIRIFKNWSLICELSQKRSTYSGIHIIYIWWQHSFLVSRYHKLGRLLKKDIVIKYASSLNTHMNHNVQQSRRDILLTTRINLFLQNLHFPQSDCAHWKYFEADSIILLRWVNSFMMNSQWKSDYNLLFVSYQVLEERRRNRHLARTLFSI